MTIGERIALLLEATEMSQAELARRVKIDQSSINGLIRGATKTSRHLHRIASELGTTPAYLTGETDDPAGAGISASLTSEEREWVELLRTLPTADRRATVHLVRSLANCARIVGEGGAQPQSPSA